MGRESRETERQVARLIVEQPELQQLYGGWMLGLHTEVWKEAEAMARTAGKRMLFDIRQAIEHLGLGQVIEQVGIDRVIEEVGVDRVIEEVGIDRVVQQVGIDRLLQQLSKKEVIKRIGLDDILANLSPAERRELKRRLQ